MKVRDSFATVSDLLNQLTEGDGNLSNPMAESQLINRKFLRRNQRRKEILESLPAALRRGGRLVWWRCLAAVPRWAEELVGKYKFEVLSLA